MGQGTRARTSKAGANEAGAVAGSGMSPWKWRLKRAWHRLDNPELRQARFLLRALREGDVDVVYISESTATFVGIDDGDSRHLGQIVRDLLQPRRTHLVAGPGYLADMIGSYVHLLAAAPRLPLVVHPLWVRGTFRPWAENPSYERKAPGAAVRALDPGTPARRVHGSFPRMRDFSHHEAIPYPTLADETGKVGDYVGRLRSGGLSGHERAELLFAYHHSGRPSPNGLDSVTHLGRALGEVGCRTVAYETPVNVQTTLDLLGERWRDHHTDNVRALNDAYLAGLGRPGRILPTAWEFTPDEYVDPFDGVEHLNGQGRQRMARLVADAVTEELERP
jgi:hypothetical protein